jgi:SAM-dependent methyltransferase
MGDLETGNAARKWNNKYLTDERFQNVPPRRLIRENSHLLPSSGSALEIAGGMGSTTDFLQRHGLDVIEIDISFEALHKAFLINNNAGYILGDARNIPVKPMQFDVICNFYYLERSVFDFIKRALKSGGLLFFETMTADMVTVRPEIPMERLLQPGELAHVFAEWEFLYSFEGWIDSEHGKKKAVSQLIARRPFPSV